jgi:hypothetical protein
MAESAITTALAVYLLTHKKPLKRLGARSRVVNTQLKQGVNEKSVDAKLYPNSFSP